MNGSVNVPGVTGPDFKKLKDDVRNLEESVFKTFGVVWDYSNPSTELTRLTRATDPNHFVTVDVITEPVAAVGTGAGSSPFDSYYPWAGMDEVNIVDGEVKYRRGESGFSRTAYDTMVSIPAFYYCIKDDPANSKRYFYVSDTSRAGFSLHPAFNRGDGKVRNTIYVGRFNTGDGHTSKSGEEPLGDLTRDEFRTGAAAKGAGWSQYDYIAWSAVLLLYVVEYADWDSQTVVGMGNVNTSEKHNTGGTDRMVYHTGRDDTNDSENIGYDQVQYRHIEDPWGNVFEWLDGINFYNKKAYVCFDPANFDDDTDTNYIDTGLTLPANGYISALGFSESMPFLFVPTANGGDESSYIPDRVNSSTGWRVCRVGGYYSLDTVAGLFYINGNNASDNSNSNYGARLLFLP